MSKSVALYEKLVATIPGVERKGATMPYTSLNGNMYSYVAKDGTVNLPLPEDVRQKFIAKYKTKLTQQYRIVQKEYVVVPATLLEKTAELEPYFAISHAYCQSLRPKKTTRGK